MQLHEEQEECGITGSQFKQLSQFIISFLPIHVAFLSDLIHKSTTVKFQALH